MGIKVLQHRSNSRLILTSIFVLLFILSIGSVFLLTKTDAVHALAPGPAGVDSGLKLWLTASQGVKSTGGASALDGEAVGEWVDQSPEARTAINQSSPAIYNNQGLNFNPTLAFSDSNYTASDIGLPSGSADRSIFVVASANSGGWRYVLGAGTFGGGNGFDFGHNANDGSVFITSHSSQEAGTGSWSPYGSARLAYGAVEGTELYIAVNGSSPIQGSGGSVNTVLDGALNIGANSGGVELWDGNISEVIFYDRVVTPLERQQINSYLALKYGFSLDQAPAQSYLSSQNTIIWDKDAPGANIYNNGLFGIGRDDQAGLTQVKSLGQTATNILTVEAIDEGTNTQPAFKDMGNLESLVIGDNDQAANWTTTGAPGSYSILERKWMKQEVGTVGEVKFSFDTDDPDMDIPTALGDGYYYFIYDTDNDGNLADETPVALTDEGNGIWSSTVNLGAGGLFTLATSASPAILNLSPLDNSTGVAVNSNLQVRYSRPVAADSGTIAIYKANGQLVEQIGVTDTSRVTGSGTDTVTINPFVNLEYATDYYVLISSTAFGDLPDYAPGITSSTAWNFRTADGSTGVPSPIVGDVQGQQLPRVPNTGFVASIVQTKNSYVVLITAGTLSALFAITAVVIRHKKHR